MAPAPAPELSVFVSMAPASELCFFYNVPPAPAPELCFFITWFRLWLRSGSGCALLIHFNDFAIPSALHVASEGVIPIYFEPILNCYHYQTCVAEVGRSLVLSNRSG